MINRLKAFVKGRALWNCPWDFFIYLRAINPRELVVGDRVAYGHKMDELMTVDTVRRTRNQTTIKTTKGYFTYFDGGLPPYVISDRRAI